MSREFGGETYCRVCSPKTTFGGLRNWGWSGRCLFPLREMTESRQKGGGTYRSCAGHSASSSHRSSRATHWLLYLHCIGAVQHGRAP